MLQQIRPHNSFLNFGSYADVLGGAVVVVGAGVDGAGVDGAGVEGAGVEGAGVDGAGVELVGAGVVGAGVELDGAGVGASVHAPMLPQSSCGLRLSLTSPSIMAGI